MVMYQIHHYSNSNLITSLSRREVCAAGPFKGMNMANDSTQRTQGSLLPISGADQEQPGKRRLPPDYFPDDTAIICGRGKACTASAGNTRLKDIVLAHIDQYSRATNKTDKTKTVNAILDAVQGDFKDQGMFVRKHNEEWWEVEDTIAREKVGCMIRDILHTKYRSSSKAKFEKKKRRKSLLAVDEAKAIYDAADLIPPSAIGLGSVSSPMMPSLISGGRFTLRSAPNLPQRSHTRPRPGDSQSNTSPVRHVPIPESIVPQDRQIMFGSDSTLMTRIQRTPQSPESPPHFRNIGKAAKRQRTGEKVGTTIPEPEKQSSIWVTQKDGDSPESTGWVVEKTGGSRHQAQAAAAKSDVQADEELPDDLSGIFDD